MSMTLACPWHSRFKRSGMPLSVSTSHGSLDPLSVSVRINQQKLCNLSDMYCESSLAPELFLEIRGLSALFSWPNLTTLGAVAFVICSPISTCTHPIPHLSRGSLFFLLLTLGQTFPVGMPERGNLIVSVQIAFLSTLININKFRLLYFPKH